MSENPKSTDSEKRLLHYVVSVQTEENFNLRVYLDTLNNHRSILLEALLEHCAETNGDGKTRCRDYDKGDNGMCWRARRCLTWSAICKATGHDRSKPWEVGK